MNRGEQLLVWLEQIVDVLTTWQNTTLQVQIALTDRNFDKHGTSYTNFMLCLDFFSVRTSGARFICMGKQNELIEITTDYLIDVKIQEHEVIFLEQWHKDFFRKVTLKRIHS